MKAVWQFFFFFFHKIVCTVLDEHCHPDFFFFFFPDTRDDYAVVKLFTSLSETSLIRQPIFLFDSVNVLQRGRILLGADLQVK